MGSAIAVGIMVIAKAIIVDPLSDDLALIDNFNTIAFGPLIAALVVGSMALSALGSGVTLRRFLRI
jgi:cell division transport system permease protein